MSKRVFSFSQVDLSCLREFEVATYRIDTVATVLYTNYRRHCINSTSNMIVRSTVTTIVYAWYSMPDGLVIVNLEACINKSSTSLSLGVMTSG